MSASANLPSRPAGDPMRIRTGATGDDRAAVVLRLASELPLGGQDAEQTVRTAERLARCLGIDGVLLPGWNRVELLTRGEERSTRIELREAASVAVKVRRVSPLIAQSDALLEGRAGLSGAADRIAAAGADACALAVIFGKADPDAFATVAVVAGLGRPLRRWLGRRGAGLLLQDAAASCVAGLGAGLAARTGLSGDLDLVAVCPCMILIPGPHLLNGAADLLFYRVTLGASRLIFVAVALTASTVALLLGLAAAGSTLPLGATHAAVPLWRDMIAGGVASACYGVLYAMLTTMLVWPAAVGIVVHTAHRGARAHLGMGPAPAAAIASVVAGTLLAHVARRYHLPSAGVGFASVVSMPPGILLFPMGRALVAIGQGGTASSAAPVVGAVGDGVTASLVVLGMTLGLLSPQILFDAWRRSPARVVLPHRMRRHDAWLNGTRRSATAPSGSRPGASSRRASSWPPPTPRS